LKAEALTPRRGEMLRGRHSLCTLCALAVLALLGVPSASAYAYYPLLRVQADHHLLGGVDDLTFNLEYLSSAGQAEKMTIQTPAGFNASLVQAVGTNLGRAGLGALPSGTNISASPSAAVTRYMGSVMVMDPSAYANDPTAQACAPGSHTAVWNLTLLSGAGVKIEVPVAVDASQGGYRLTMCFDALRAIGKEVEYVYLTPEQVFRNPGKHGTYLFDGVVTPYAAGDSSTGSPSYELRAYQVLPQLLTATPNYSQKSQMLTVTGKLEADGRARKNTWIHVYAAVSDQALKWADLGTAVTARDGSYSFTTRLTKLHYGYVYTNVDASGGATCPGTSIQPGGCASTSSDGRSSLIAKIAVQS
jgi:hypothetical protein